ncbi:MAG: hypothetical protein QM627_12870 [Luteolibacter sp.]
MTIEIRQETVAIQGEDGMTSYEAYNISGRGRIVATITGEMKPAKHFGADMIALDDGTYALRDILSFAQRNMRGLTLI